MNIINFQYQLALIIGLILSVIAGACGKIGEPLPPLSTIPRPVLDLMVQQEGQKMTLSWTMPQFNVDGSSAGTISAINIYRLIRHRDNSSPNFSSVNFDSNPWKSVQYRELNDQNAQGKIVFLDLLEDLKPEESIDRDVSYALEVLNNKQKSAGFSNVVTLSIFPVPLPPTTLNFVLNERFIEIRWIPSGKGIDGSKVMLEVKFNVYRSEHSGVYESTPINATPILGNYFRDRSTGLGKKTYYKVRAVVKTPQGLIESQDSNEASIINNDIYPPTIPKQITIVSTQTSLDLIWFPNSEIDIAGYHIYRKEKKSRFIRISSDLIRQTSFSDSTVKKGTTYFYKVTAIDQSKNESGYSEVVSDAIE